PAQRCRPTSCPFRYTTAVWKAAPNCTRTRLPRQASGAVRRVEYQPAPLYSSNPSSTFQVWGRCTGLPPARQSGVVPTANCQSLSNRFIVSPPAEPGRIRYAFPDPAPVFDGSIIPYLGAAGIPIFAGGVLFLAVPPH